MDQLGDSILIATVAFLVAGVVKGTSGMGLPTTALGIMTLSLDPRTGIALVLFPMLVTNGWQMLSEGELRRTVRRYWIFALVLGVGVAATTFGTAKAADEILLAALGGVILLFVFTSWAGWLPDLPDRFDWCGQVGFGVFGGVIGGLTGAWAPALGMYLTMRGVDKAEFIRATGFLIFVGSVPLAVSYLQLGFLTGPLLISSGAMVVPSLIGLSLGVAIRSRLSVEAFRNAVLLVFVVLAINLLRRAIF